MFHHSSLPSKGLIFVSAPVDVEIKLDEEGYVLPASHNDDVYKRYMVLCIRQVLNFRFLIILNIKFESWMVKPSDFTTVFTMLQDSSLYRRTKEVHYKQEAATWKGGHQAATPEASGI